MVCPRSTQEETHRASHNTLQHTCMQSLLPQPLIPASFAMLQLLAKSLSWPADSKHEEPLTGQQAPMRAGKRWSTHLSSSNTTKHWSAGPCSGRMMSVTPLPPLHSTLMVTSGMRAGTPLRARIGATRETSGAGLISSPAVCNPLLRVDSLDMYGRVKCIDSLGNLDSKRSFVSAWGKRPGEEPTGSMPASCIPSGIAVCGSSPTSRGAGRGACPAGCLKEQHQLKENLHSCAVKMYC